MIAQLSGTVTELNPSSLATIDVNGVGYEVICSARLVEQLEVGSTCRIVIHTDVKEDSINLFGFASVLEKRVFLLLKSVSGVGPKSAREILSQIEDRELLRLIGASDVVRLQSVRGIGKKTSERIVVELRDKVAQLSLDPQTGGTVGLDRGSAQRDAVAALETLGFSRRDAERAVEMSVGGNTSETDTAEIVRQALRNV